MWVEKFNGIDLIDFETDPLQSLHDFIQEFTSILPQPGVPYKEEISFLLRSLPDISEKLGYTKHDAFFAIPLIRMRRVSYYVHILQN